MITDDSLRTYLAELPVPAPPATLWPKLDRARTRRLRRHRVGIGVAGLAMLALLAVPVPVPQPDPGALHPTAPGVADRAALVVASPPRSDAALGTLRALDRELQAAYARGASDQELAPLWSARDAALAVTRSATGPRPRG